MASDTLHNYPRSNPGLLLPGLVMQNQIHELAKTLPPPRKQNTACDACRTRKVKCQRLPGQEKCQHCLSKNYPCTHYVQQATSEKKRNSNVARRPRNLSSAARFDPLAVHSPSNGHSNGYLSPLTHSATSPTISSSSLTTIDDSATISPFSSPVPQSFKHWFTSPITLNTPTPQVLTYLFSPPECHSSEASTFALPRGRAAYADWGEQAYKLDDDKFRAEFALDLVEVFFQIVHTRLPLLNPSQFRSQLGLHSSYVGTPRAVAAEPTTPTNATTAPSKRPLHPALVATVIAWGSKFSEHPLLIADRARRGGQSAFSKTLIDRARELAENMKVHRVPSADNVVIALLIEPLQCQTPGDQDGYQGFWLLSGIRNMLNLQINHKTVMSSIQDPEARGTMIFAWWMACLSDAFSAIYYRRKPILDDDDYDIDFYIADGISTESTTTSPREQLEFLGYYRAAHALARIARSMARTLWKPATELDGVQLADVCAFVTQLDEWRGQYLALVGVPNNFKAEWDFVSAVSACASDATYHIMWIFLFSALDEFGIKDVNDAVRGGSSPTSATSTHSHSHSHAQVESAKRKTMDEALHAALRIAGLAGVLTSNGYLRLDPAVMHVSCMQAGFLLARLARPEVSNCIAALEQYSAAYEEMGECALEIRRVWAAAKGGESELNHMAGVVVAAGAAGSRGGDAPVAVAPATTTTMASQQQQQQPQQPQHGGHHAMMIDTTNGVSANSDSDNGFSHYTR